MRLIALSAPRVWLSTHLALVSTDDGFTRRTRRGGDRLGIVNIELIEVRGNEAELNIDGRTHLVPFVNTGTEISFAYDGEIWIVELADKSRARARHLDHSMSAPMPGIVLKILVNVGDVVAKGAALII